MKSCFPFVKRLEVTSAPAEMGSDEFIFKTNCHRKKKLMLGLIADKNKKNVIPVYREILLVTIMLFWVICGREYLAIPTEESFAVISSKCYVMIIWPSHALVNHF